MNPSGERKALASQFDVIKLGHLDSDQFTVILGFLIATKVFLTLPSYITKRIGTGAWLTIAFSGVLAAVGLWGWVGWCKATGNLGFVPSVRLTLGRVMGDLTVLAVTVYFVLVTSFSVRVFAGGAVIGLLPEFPIEILIVIVVISSIYAAWLGLETVARAAIFFYPLIVLTIVIVGLGSYRIFDIRHLHPVLGMGFPSILREAAVQFGIYGGIAMAAIFKSYLRNPDQLPKAAFTGLSVATLFMMASVILVSAILPYPENTRHVIALGVIARTVYLGRFLQKIEALFTFTWFFASAVHARTCYMVTLVLLCQLMNTRTYRPLVPGVGLLTFGIAALPTSIHAAGRLLSAVYTYLGSFSVVLGPVLYLVAKVRGTEKAAARISQTLGALIQSPEYSEDTPGQLSRPQGEEQP
ncbi:MAG: GerAB/ArcD/ProY family transporter [Bacillota bacterium]